MIAHAFALELPLVLVDPALPGLCMGDPCGMRMGLALLSLADAIALRRVDDCDKLHDFSRLYGSVKRDEGSIKTMWLFPVKPPVSAAWPSPKCICQISVPTTQFNPPQYLTFKRQDLLLPETDRPISVLTGGREQQVQSHGTKCQTLPRHPPEALPAQQL